MMQEYAIYNQGTIVDGAYVIAYGPVDNTNYHIFPTGNYQGTPLNLNEFPLQKKYRNLYRKDTQTDIGIVAKSNTINVEQMGTYVRYIIFTGVKTR